MRRSLLGFGMEWKSFRFLRMLAPRWLVVIVLIEAGLARRTPAHIGSDSLCFASRFPIFGQQCAGGRVMGGLPAGREIELRQNGADHHAKHRGRACAPDL